MGTEAIDAPWAKTHPWRPAPGSPWPLAWLSVSSHCVDVSACLRSLLRGITLARLSVLAGRPLSETDIERLCVLGMSHDFYKVCLGFSDKIRGGAVGLYRGHCGQPLQMLNKPSDPVSRALARAAGWDGLLPWFGGDPKARNRALRIVFSHHGGCKGELAEDCLVGQAARTKGGHLPAAELASLAATSLALHPLATDPDALPLPTQAAFWHFFAGLLMLADHLGSANDPAIPDAFPLNGSSDTAVARHAASLSRSGRLLSAAGFHGSPGARRNVRSTEVTGGRRLRVMQQAVADVPLSARSLVLEALTGDGKTEGALIRFVALHAAGLVDGLAFFVPTRSAGRQIHARVQRILERLYPGSPPVALAMGGAPRLGFSDGGNWATADLSNALGAWVVVGTVDQALLAALRTGGAQARMAALLRTLVVIDEVHASDGYMSGVIGRFLAMHTKAGGYAMTMSATLGNRLASLLSGQDRLPYAEACAVPYPLLRHVTDGVACDVAGPPVDSRRIRTEFCDLAGLVGSVGRAVAAGARVLVIRSTVGEALLTQAALEEAGIPTLAVTCPDGRPVHLAHHGRFAAADRRMLDVAVEDALAPGTDWTPARRGLAVVSTQTCEQTLDLDADLLVTDPCPADVLIQRLGRLFRSLQGRPPDYGEPLCLMLDPGDLDRYVREKGVVAVPEGGLGFAKVYQGLVGIRQTLERVRGGWLELPAQCREMVEEATHPEHLAAMTAGYGPRWVALNERLEDDSDGFAAKGRRASFKWDICPTHPDNLIRADAEMHTRIGADRVAVEVAFTSFLGNRIKLLEVDYKFLGSAEIVSAQVLREDVQVAVIKVVSGDRTVIFVYDKQGLRPQSR